MLGPVVVVVVDDADSAAEALFNVGGEGGLAAAGSSGDADEDRLWHGGASFLKSLPLL